MGSGGNCPSCGGCSIAYNDARGEKVCTNCGTVISAGAMVDQVSFAGGGKMQGQFVDVATGNVRGFAALYSKRESSELALRRGFYNLERVANRLQMSQALIESSKRLYSLALKRNFTIGRNNYFVVSACLYAICRREKAAWMMIDFSDAIMTPVKTLAQVFMKLVRSLSLAVNPVDPSLFMDRFAHQMPNLGTKANQVAATGVRLVQAMQRDWIATGRRPLGLIAASLLIASRYHKTSLHPDDIREIFRVCGDTIEKRLDEFSHTEAAALTVKDFENVDLEQLKKLALPPCAMKTSQRTKRRRILNSTKPAHELTEQEVEEILALQEQQQHYSVPSLAGAIELPASARAQLCIEDISTNKMANLATSMALAIEKSVSENIPVVQAPRSVPEELPTKASELVDCSDASLLSVMTGVGKEAKSIVESLSPFSKEQEIGVTQGLPSASGDESPLPVDELAVVPVASPSEAPSIYGGGQLVARIRQQHIDEWAIVACEDDEEVVDVDDVDVEEYLLSPEEKEAKAAIWDELTKDIMTRVYERARERKQRMKQRELNGGEPLHQRRPPLPAMSSPTDAVKAVLTRSSATFKTKLNEDAVSQLFDIASV